MWVKGEYHTNFDSAEAIARGTNGKIALNSSSEIAPHYRQGLFDRFAWFRNLYAHTCPEKPVLIPRAIASGLSLWLFLVQQKTGHFSSLSNYYSFHFRPVFSGVDSGETRLPLMIALARRLKKQAASITLYPVPDADGSADLICDAFRKSSWIVQRSEATIKHSLILNGRDFDAYWAGRPGDVRNTVARKSKKGIVDIQIFDRFDANAWASYEEIYAQSWKTAEGNPDFLRALAKAEGKSGRLRIGVATIDGKAVAAQFWTVESGIAYIHKLAHIPDDVKASPGTLLSVALFRHVIDVDGVKAIDFGTGDDAYKFAWMEQRETLSRITLLNPTHPGAWWPIAKHLARSILGRVAGRG